MRNITGRGARCDTAKRSRVWVWFLPLAVAQVVMAVRFWRVSETENVTVPPPAPEVALEQPDKDAESVTLYFTPVAVTATRNRSDDSATIVVSQGHHQFEYHTDIVGSDAIPWEARVKQGVGWKGDYLFVMNENSGYPWRSATDAVLMLQAGRLEEVGSIARTHQAHAEPLGPGYHDGYFHDRIEKFAGDVDVFGPKGMGWELVLREENGRFVADLDRTWAENQERLKTNEDDGKDLLRKGAKDRAKQRHAIACFGENALVAMYCGRVQEAGMWMQRAHNVSEPGALRQLEAMEKDLTPGEIPCYEH